jgi:dinuclear metal center YbgI/SA1388 family protein
MTHRTQVLQAINAILQPERFQDYGPNGLQVEGRAQVHKIVTGVTASVALIEAAIAAEADVILVHHGLFWRGHDGCVTGWLRQRLKLLLGHDINLLAYHLPLDAHPEWGNNAQIAARMGWVIDGRFGEQNLGFLCTRDAMDVAQLARSLEVGLQHAVQVVPGDGRRIQRVAWCSGGAQSYFEDAVAAGADVFITGEISEPQYHWARETGVAYLACGHHATERYGVQAVAAQVAHELGLQHEFIDIDNPV